MVQKTSENYSSWPVHKILFIVSILGIVGSYFAYFLGSFFGIRYYLGSFSYIFYILLIVSGVMFFFKKKDTKVYKSKTVPTTMKIQYIFYIVGVLFIFASVWYFAGQFIAELPNFIKLILLVFSVIISFIIAELLRGADK